MIINSIKGEVSEYLFVDRLNNKKIGDLPFTLQLLIKDLFNFATDDMIVHAWRSSFLTKTDLYIKVKDKIVRASLKKGVKNSVHSETIQNFVIFLKNLGLPTDMTNIYLLYHYGDGTIDGSGQSRLSAEELKKIYQSEIDKFNLALNDEKIISKAIDRFMIRGRNDTDRVSVLIYGTPIDFIWIKREEIYNLLLSKKDQYSTGPHFSRLSIQPMNRCLNNNQKYDKGRHIVQIKWYNIYDDVIEYRNQTMIEQKALDN